MIGYTLFYKPIDARGGMFLRASCFDGGVSNIRVGCMFSSKSIGKFIANNAAVRRLDLVEMNGRWCLANCFGNRLTSPFGCDGGGGSDVRAAFKFDVPKLGCLWIYGSSRE